MHKDFTFPIGPVHPALKESTCLRLTLDGNYIQEAKIRLGYIHRGMEKLLEGKEINQALYLVQKSCGICSYAHESAYARAIEKMLKYDAPEKVKLVRVITAELERIHSHLLWAGFMLHEIGYETMFMFFWKERERILEIFEKLTGGRVHHAMNKIKTVRYDLLPEDKKFMFDRLQHVERKTKDYTNIINSNKIILARIRDVGYLSRNDARKFCLVGPMSRGSGIKSDIRKSDPYEAYKGLDFEEIIEDNGDAYARTMVRLREILESIKIIRQALENLPKEKIPEPSPVFIEKASGFGRVEAPRGENFHFLSVRKNVLERIRIRTPTFANIIVLEDLLVGREIGDTPVIINSIDPCFGCMERVMVVKDDKIKIFDEEEFRRFACTK
jgi:NADH-quinone oxidoreductase subunit D